MNAQIRHVNNKLAKNSSIIYKLRRYLNLHTLKQVYYTLIYPFLTYGLTSWGNTYKTTYAKIITKQNKCVRAMFFANRRENPDPYYGILDLLKFENIFKLKIVEFTKKISKMN